MPAYDHCDPLQATCISDASNSINLLETIVNEDQVKGRAKEAKGKVKEVAGKIIGNKTQETKGKVEKTVGKVQKDLGDLANEGEKDSKKGA